MPRHVEKLDGGLNTIDDPADLEPGELSAGRNWLYLAGPGALDRARGRVSFGVVSATAVDVVGLRDIQFDNSDHYLIAAASSSLFSAVVGDSGSFTNLTTIPAVPNSLEAVQYRNRYYLFNGVTAAATSINTNTVVYLSATAALSAPQVRQHGMLPVLTGPIVTTAGAGSFTQTVTGYYDYWTTEVAKLTQDGAELVLESAFQGNPGTAFISATTVQPTIQQPSIQNSITTHWRVYRSPKKDTATEVKFPSGFMVAEASTATAQIVDTETGSLTSFISPALFNGTTNRYADASAQATAMAATPGVFCDFNSGTPGILKTSQGMYNFSFGGFSGSIVGIEVQVVAYATGVLAGFTPFTCIIGPNRLSNGEFGYYGGHGQGLSSQTGIGAKPASKSALITATAPAGQTITLGSGTDPWTAPDQQRFVDTDFGSNFMVVIQSGSFGDIFVDTVKVRVTYGATSKSSGVIPFPSVVYEFGGVTAQVARNHPPPSSNTGDVYEDSLVVNDVSNAGLVRWSYPGEPEYFPPTYYLDFETRENDQVRAIQTVNNRLVVWLDSSTHRMNYLPSERDASFDRGKATDPITRSFGAVNPMCVCKFSMDNSPELGAFVSNQGIHATDGFSFLTFTDKIDWRNTVMATANASAIALVNDRERRQLLFFFRNDAYAPESYLCLPLCYHSQHLVNGKPKIGGLIHMRNYHIASTTNADLKSAWVSPRSAGDASLYLGYGGAATVAGAGKVYIETGTDIPAQDPRMKFTTRRMYLAERGNEWEFGELYGYTTGYGATTPGIAYTLLTTKTNDAGETTGPTKNITLAGQSLHKVTFRQMCEGAKISMVATASAWSYGDITIDGTNFGLEDSGR
jgi:hypothetical protein